MSRIAKNSYNEYKRGIRMLRKLEWLEAFKSIMEKGLTIDYGEKVYWNRPTLGVLYQPSKYNPNIWVSMDSDS